MRRLFAQIILGSSLVGALVLVPALALQSGAPADHVSLATTVSAQEDALPGTEGADGNGTTTAGGGVVACGPGTDDPTCDLCGLFETGYNIIRMGFFFVGPIVVLMIIISGIYYITSAGFEEKVKRAKTSLTGAIIGLVIIFVSYAAVNAIATAFGYKADEAGEADIFGAVDCSKFINPLTDVSPPSALGGGEGGLYCSLTATCDSCVSIPNTIANSERSRSNRVNTAMLERLLDLKGRLTAQGIPSLNTKTPPAGTKSWRVTEAFPPTSIHQDPKHCNGKAVDIAIYPSNPENFMILWSAVKDANFTLPLNESGFELDGVDSESGGTGAHLHVRVP